MTGVDLSEGMISQARRKATEGGFECKFNREDLRSLHLKKIFDAVISMFAVVGYQVANDDFIAALRLGWRTNGGRRSIRS